MRRAAPAELDPARQRCPISVLELDRSVTGADASVGLLRGLVALADAMGRPTGPGGRHRCGDLTPSS